MSCIQYLIESIDSLESDYTLNDNFFVIFIQIFGIIFTFGGSAIIEGFNSLTANSGFVGALVIGAILTVIIKPDLRRQAADKNKNNFDNDSKLLNKI